MRCLRLLVKRILSRLRIIPRNQGLHSCLSEPDKPGGNGRSDRGGHGEEMYTTEGMAAEFRQGEIISDFAQDIYDPESNGTFFERMPYVIILAHDCDMLRDYQSRTSGGPNIMNGILIYEMETEAQVRTAGRAGGHLNTGLWRIVEKNNHERYHHLDACSPESDLEGKGFPILAIDFRRYFTVSAKEIERQLRLENGAKRRCRLASPYREHLQSRAAYYFQRIVLPDRND